MTEAATTPGGVKPYGLGGLVISTLLIVGGAGVLLFAVVTGAIVFGGNSFQTAIDALAAYDMKQLANAPVIIQRHFFTALIVVFLIVLPPLLLAARIRGGRSWSELLALRRFLRRLERKWLMLILVAAPFYLVASGLFVKAFFPAFRTWFFVPSDPQGMVLSCIAVIIVAPVVEEMLFRGWIYTSLRKSFRASTAIAISTILFAAAHSDGGLTYPALVLVPGIVLAVVREWTGSTWASMAIHAMFNAWAWGLQLALGDKL